MTTFGLRGATCLVTGGAGLIGSHIVDQLLDAGADEVRVFDNLSRGRRENLAHAQSRTGFRFILGDIRNQDAVQKATTGCDYVFHEAALRITRCAESPRECVDVLATGTLNIFEAAVKAKVRKVVYASSASVYGGSNHLPTIEPNHSYPNRSLYGAPKCFVEELAHSFFDSARLGSVGLRYFNVYGPHMNLTGDYTDVLMQWLDCVEQDRPPQILGDGSTIVDFVYVEDVARANLLALQSDRNDNVYNIASGTETTLLQLWRTFQEVTCAYHLEPELHPSRAVNRVPRPPAEIRSAQRDLGFVPAVGLTEGVANLVAGRISPEEKTHPPLAFTVS
jgi:UDP-glucose 4-epimerase